jgi:hypothetical protein
LFKCYPVGQRFQFVVRRVDVNVRQEQKQVEADELDAVHFRRGGQGQHRVQIVRRLGARPRPPWPSSPTGAAARTSSA